MYVYEMELGAQTGTGDQLTAFNAIPNLHRENATITATQLLLQSTRTLGRPPPMISRDKHAAARPA